MNKLLKKTLKIILPILLGGFILYWVYRDFDFSKAEEEMCIRDRKIRRADRDNTIDVYISEDHDDVLANGVWQQFFTEKPEVLTLSLIHIFDIDFQ